MQNQQTRELISARKTSHKHNNLVLSSSSFYFYILFFDQWFDLDMDSYVIYQANRIKSDVIKRYIDTFFFFFFKVRSKSFFL